MSKVLAKPASAGKRVGSLLSLFAIAGFVLAAFCAKYDLAHGQTFQKKGKKATPPVVEKKEDGKKSAPVEQAKSLTNGQKVETVALGKLIDQEVMKRLNKEGVKAVPVCDDAEFLRRVHLDLVGVIPSAEKARAFLDSKDPAKRQKLVDELLADPRFGTFMAEVWTTLMIPRESNNRALKVESLQKWLAAGFNEGKPLDKLVHELVTSTGTQEENGAVTYFIGNNTVDKITDSVSRMFMGVQLQCAQCHNHPFTDYKQNEYWGMAAFFMKTRASANPQQAAKKGTPIVISESTAAKGKKQMLPESAKIVPAKFLQGASPKIAAADPARPVLADWMTSKDNPFFAKAMVNRFWFQMFGRGLVHTVDDMHDDNPASHPELLATLTEQFKLNNFDTKQLLKAIIFSDAYQRTSKSTVDSASIEPDLYSQRIVRTMHPEQLFDSLVSVVGKGPLAKGKGEAKAADKKGPVGPRDNFISFFRVDEFNPFDYTAGIPQALRIMNSQLTNRGEFLGVSLAGGAKSPREAVENIYLAVLSRRPTEAETTRLVKHVADSKGLPRAAYGDIVWALLNSSEFVLNH